jgi:hypothetical protein
LRILTGWVTSIFFLALGISVPTEASAPTEKGGESIQVLQPLSQLGQIDRESVPPVLFNHGSIDWLPELALKAGWPKETHEKLGQII